MRPKLSAGHDGIPSALIKTYHDLFCPVLCEIFNNSLKTGIFPDMWKLAVVVPVHKTGKSGDVSNYRPISLLSSFSKLFETVVHKFLSFSFRNLLIPNQHGFVHGRSTTTNLVTFMSTASRVVCSQGQLDVVYFDLSKAFDLVDHKILLAKLYHYGVGGELFEWFKSYLLHRKGFVRVNHTASRPYKTNSGVPQGSVLGPLLFSIFVNDVSLVISHSLFLQYADDIKIYREIRTIDDCARLQTDVNSFNIWFKENKLRLNRSKTKVMTFSRKMQNVCFPYRIDGELLSRVTEIRDLGVVFESNLRFDVHVGKMISASLRALGVVCRVSREFTNPCTFITLYCSLSRSQLEYSSVVWNGICKTNSLRIERIQKTFISIFIHRYLTSDDHSLNYEALLKRIKLLGLYRRREKADLLFLFKTLHGSIDSPGLLSELRFRVPRVATRLNSPFYIPVPFSTICPIPRLLECYNGYAEKLDIFDSSSNKFGHSVESLFELESKISSFSAYPL